MDASEPSRNDKLTHDELTILLGDESAKSVQGTLATATTGTDRQPPAGPVGEAINHKIKILVVEDDFAIRQLYDKGLFDDIFVKRIVGSGKEALRVYAEWCPDIILLDIFLPEMTGYQVLKEIRTTMEDRKTTIVMATALSGRDDVLSCVKLGIEGYIVKPFPYREIGKKAAIRRLLEETAAGVKDTAADGKDAHLQTYPAGKSKQDDTAPPPGTANGE